MQCSKNIQLIYLHAVKIKTNKYNNNFLLSEIEFEYKTMFRVKSCNKRHHLNDTHALKSMISIHHGLVIVFMRV